MSVISQKTSDDLSLVIEFFGIDRKSNLHLFRAASDFDRDAFARSFGALATAVRGDPRYGINERIKAAIAAEKAKGERPC